MPYCPVIVHHKLENFVAPIHIFTNAVEAVDGLGFGIVLHLMAVVSMIRTGSKLSRI